MKLAYEGAFNLLCGRLIGEGSFRKVFECKMDPALVVKVEKEDDGERNFMNVREYTAWDYWSHCPDVQKWLAPCVSLSPCGLVLLQRRTEPLRRSELPKKLPRFLTDHQLGNYGKLKGKIVCHDYAMLVFDCSTTLRKVEWW